MHLLAVFHPRREMESPLQMRKIRKAGVLDRGFWKPLSACDGTVSLD